MSDLRKITIGIAEDHELFRTSLQIALSQNPQFKILWVCNHSDQFENLFVKENPDLVLMDIGLHTKNGIELTKNIKTNNKTTKVVMLTAHNENEVVLKALQAGADAYCTKEIAFDKLAEVITMVMEGAIWLDPAIASYLYDFVKDSQVLNQENTYNLSARELEVLELMVQGLSNKEIAKKLFITIHTVKAHVCSTIQKLSARDRTDAAVKAVRYRLV